MKIATYIIDTFTSVIFKGNPTAVCVLTEGIDEKLMASIAIELNLPVTAFCYSNKNNEIRYFTITGEILACGHATLAAAKVIFEIQNTTYTNFKTTENRILQASKINEIIYLTYPKFKTIEFDLPDKMLQGLGLKKYKSKQYCTELETLFIEIESPSLLRNINPDFKMLLESSNQIKEVVVTSISDNANYDFLFRSFCPG